MRTAVVFAGGPHRLVSGALAPAHDSVSSAVAAADDVPTRVRAALDDLHADVVVAADSGVHLAQALGRSPNVVVGDMDSVDPERLEQAVHAGAELRRHPVDKESTDLELALEVVLADGVDAVTVVGSDAGRFDHLLGGVLTLASARFARMRIDAWLGGVHLWVVHDARQIVGRPGGIVSILPVGGPAQGVRTSGLRWPLYGELLEPGTSRGVSNEFLDEVAHVSVDDGRVVVVVPEEEPT
jgi:thiamine pyrophosphokinase